MSSLGLRCFSGGSDEGSFSKPYSEQTERKIDDEVTKIINDCLKSTRELVKKHENEIEMYIKCLK